jgi:cytochrome bd-type quinol oxidase subunit 2
MNSLRLLSITLTALALGAGLAHLFALPNKMQLSDEQYLVVQQIYRNWEYLVIFPLAAFGVTLALTILSRNDPKAFWFTLLAALCIAAAIAMFFLFNYPANAQTENWTTLPSNWRDLRARWELAHAASAVLNLIALILLTLSLLPKRRDSADLARRPGREMRHA